MKKFLFLSILASALVSSLTAGPADSLTLPGGRPGALAPRGQPRPDRHQRRAGRTHAGSLVRRNGRVGGGCPGRRIWRRESCVPPSAFGLQRDHLPGRLVRSRLGLGLFARGLRFRIRTRLGSDSEYLLVQGRAAAATGQLHLPRTHGGSRAFGRHGGRPGPRPPPTRRWAATPVLSPAPSASTPTCPCPRPAASPSTISGPASCFRISRTCAPGTPPPLQATSAGRSAMGA